MAQGSAALTVMEGVTGRALISKAIQSSPAAREFFAGVLGIKAEKLMAMDPALRQAQLLTSLNAQRADQVTLVQKATGFIQSAKTSATDISLSGEEIFGGETSAAKGLKRLPLPSSPTTTPDAPMLEKFTNQLVNEGAITRTEGETFVEAVKATEVDGPDVEHCISQWKQPENKALYVRTVIEGAKLMPDGEAAVGAMSETISRNLGVSRVEARRRVCFLAGAGNKRCRAYSREILKECL